MNKIRRFITVLLIGVIVSLSGCCTIFKIGCKPVPPPSPDDPTVIANRINDTVNRIEANSLKIDELVNSSVDSLNTLYKEIPANVSVGNVKDSVGKIKMLNQQNIEEIPQIENDSILVSAYSKTIDSLQKIINRYEDEMYQKQQAIWFMINSFASIGLVASVFIAMYWKPSWGLSLGGGCLATIAISTFIGSHIIMVAWIGGAILAIMFAVFIYKVLRENNDVKQAFKEGVVTTEISKYAVWDDKMSKKVDALQSPITKQMVQEVKCDLQKSGYYNLPKKEETDNKSVTAAPSVTGDVNDNSKQK